MSIARKLCEYFHDARELLAQGIDPGENRKAQKATKQNRAANSFEVVAREWYAKSSPSWTQAHGRALLLVVSSGTFFRESESCAVCRLFCQTTEPERKVLLHHKQAADLLNERSTAGFLVKALTQIPPCNAVIYSPKRFAVPHDYLLPYRARLYEHPIDVWDSSGTR